MKKYYRVHFLSTKIFDMTEKIVEANSPKSAVELITGKKVKRVTSGGNIVVYGNGNGCIKSYVYEFDKEAEEV